MAWNGQGPVPLGQSVRDCMYWPLSLGAQAVSANCVAHQQNGGGMMKPQMQPQMQIRPMMPQENQQLQFEAFQGMQPMNPSQAYQQGVSANMRAIQIPTVTPQQSPSISISGGNADETPYVINMMRPAAPQQMPIVSSMPVKQ